MIGDAKWWAQKLVDNVSTATQLDPEKGELANVEDWRRNAEKLFESALQFAHATAPPKQKRK